MNNKPAFPTPFIPGRDVCDNIPAQQGMTLREWYAGVVMHGLLTKNTWTPSEATKDAVRIADNLIKELNK